MKRILAALALCVFFGSAAIAGTPLSPYSYSGGSPSSPALGGSSVTFPTSTQATWNAVSVWGDSLSQPGDGSFPGLLSGVMQRQVYIGGVGGQTSTQIATRMVAATSQYGNFTVIWAGRNNFASVSTVLADLANMVSKLSAPKRFLILSIPNAEPEPLGSGNYTGIATLNAAIAAAYPNNYLDIRALLVSQYNAGDANDVWDHTNDIPPSTLRGNTTGTLSAAISDTTTCSISLTSPLAASNGSTLKVDSETIYITTGSGQSITNCTRGYAGTTAATHLNGATASVVDALHLNATGYGYVAAQVGAWIAAHDHGLGNVAVANNEKMLTLFANPPPIGMNNPSSAAFMGGPYVKTFQGTTSNAAIKMYGSQNSGDTFADFTNIDWFNASTGGGTIPYARIGGAALSTGGCLYFGTTDSWVSGIDITSMKMCGNKITIPGNVGQLYFGSTGYISSFSDGSLKFGSTAFPAIDNSQSLGSASFRFNSIYFGTQGLRGTSGVLAQHFTSTGTKFTFNTNACNADTTVGGSSAGKFTSRTSGTCTVVINIGSQGGLYTTPTNGFSCWANDETTPANRIMTTSSTTTTVTLSGTTITGDVISFGCMGY